MANSPEELRDAAHRSKLLALQAKDPEHRAKLFAMAADMERQAIEAEGPLSGEGAAPLPAAPVNAGKGPRKRRLFRRLHKPK